MSDIIPQDDVNYQNFLEQKRIVFKASGFEISPDALSPALFPFQRDLTRWALRKGRAAIFADTGLGKTAMQVEWGRLVNKHTGLPVLIVAPLSVARQTVQEAKKLLGLDILYNRSGDNIAPLTITNYEMVKHFDPAKFAGVVLDESSILKSLDGKTKALLTEMFGEAPYRLCCTATPAPNDIAEIANHSEFLGIMSRTNMLSSFFVHDDDGWRLKGHAKEAFYRWLASWGMSIRKPSDLSYSDEGYNLPPLNIQPLFIDIDYRPEGQLFFTGMSGISGRINVRKDTITERCEAAAELVNSSSEQWLIWCGLNDESELMARLIPESVEIKGSDSPEKKIKAIEVFQDGSVRVLVTKPKIAGMGLNFQNAHNMAFVGLSDSWEMYYQCIRREYRFGQKFEVNAFIVLTTPEQEIYQNILRKEEQAKEMSEELIKNVQQYEMEEIEAGGPASSWEYKEDSLHGEGWELWLGDSVERMKEIEESSIDFSVYSPPFQSLYTYSPSERDLGNSATDEAFYAHFTFIIQELLRVTKPGRITAVHVADVPAMLVRDGYIGLKDFSGDVIRGYVKAGWIFDARIPIDKNQQAQSIRTHAKGLTFSQLERDRSWSRPALPDYILKFRKPGENKVPVVGGVSRDDWIDWANPTWPNEEDRTQEAGAFATWYGIKESDTLQGFQRARNEADERHICPLQIGTIERCIKLWSNPGELVFSPFAGIGSEVHTAKRLGRRGLGIELNPGYFREAVRNLRQIEGELKQPTLFDLLDDDEEEPVLAVNGSGAHA
jgi:superfamily II DNA or RNA helicase